MFPTCRCCSLTLRSPSRTVVRTAGEFLGTSCWPLPLVGASQQFPDRQPITCWRASPVGGSSMAMECSAPQQLDPANFLKVLSKVAENLGTETPPATARHFPVLK